MTKREINRLAKIIWNYHLLHHKLEKVDCILALGSNDTRVADYAVELFKKGYAPFVIFSGGLGKLTNKIFDKSEAEIFSEIAIKKGVPKNKNFN